MNDAIAVRPARAGEAAAVRAVGLASAGAAYGPIAGPEYVADVLERYWSEAYIERLVAEGRVLLAESGGRIIGMTSVGTRGGVPWIAKLYVLPEQHRAGIGSALLAAAMARTAKESDRIRLDCLEGNEQALAFYRAKGFHEMAREPNEERPDWPGTIWLEAELCGS